MSKSDAFVTNTLTVKRDDWLPFLADFTRTNRGAHATLEILDDSMGRFVELENRPFDGVAADAKDGESNVWISFGGTPSDHLAHCVRNVTVIRAVAADTEHGAAMEFEAGGGRTLLVVTRPEVFALPGK